MTSQAAEKRWLGIAKGLLERPTATALEQAPADYVRAFARRRGLRLEEDRYGNLVVRWPGGRARKTAPLVLMAHLDHPGFHVDDVDGKTVRMTFHGGVVARHARAGTPLSFFRPGRLRPVGHGRLEAVTTKLARGRKWLAGGTARLTSGTAPRPGFTMWDYPGFSLRGGKIVSRCLDDLLGCAAALATLDEMCRAKPRGAHVWGLFTRAEEVGFYGAIAALRARTVPRNARVLSLETSRALPHAPQRGGVILRVGDSRSVFDGKLMAVVHDVAKELAEERPTFRSQRRLMDGGACEATPFCAAGYRAGGLAVPLGNYHNMKGLDGGPPGIGPESVAVSDYTAEVELLVRLGEISGRLADYEKKTGDWMKPLAKAAHEWLGSAPLDGGGPARRTGRRS